MRNIWAKVAVHLLIILVSSSAAMAQITITGGLDKATRDVLNQLPERMRTEFIKGLAEALPLVEQSGERFLVKIREMVSDLIAKGATATQCVSVGTVKILQEEFSASIPGILRAGSGLNEKSVANYTQSFADSIGAMRANVTTKTEATELTIAYNDLFFRYSIIRCASQINPPLLEVELDAQFRRIHIPYFEWNLIVGLDRDRPNCKRIHDCVVKRRSEVEEYLKAADARDLRASDANALLKSVPAIPVLEENWFSWWRSSPIKLVDYERVLTPMREIERLVEGAKAARLSRARVEWARAEEAQKAAQTLVASHRTNVKLQDKKDAVSRHGQMLQLSEGAIKHANSAASEDPSLKGQSEKLLDAMKRNIQEANDIKAQAEKELKELADSIRQFPREIPDIAK